MGSNSTKNSLVAADTIKERNRNESTVRQPMSVPDEKKNVPPVLVSLIRDKAISVSEGRDIATQTDSSDRMNTLNDAKLDGEIYDIESGEYVVNNDRSDYKCNNTVGKTYDIESVEYVVNNDRNDHKCDNTVGKTYDIESGEDVANNDRNDYTCNNTVDKEIQENTPDTPKQEIHIKHEVVNSETETKNLPITNTDDVNDIAIKDTSLERYGKYKVRVENDKEKCTISAVTFLDSGDLVLIDRSNHKIKFVDAEFRYISAQDLSGKPWAVCAIGVDVYVTIGNTQIQHLYVKDMLIEPQRSFEVRGRCLGMCVYGEHIAVGLQIGEVHLLNTLGENHGVIRLPVLDKGKPCNPWHIYATPEGNLLITDSDEGAVFCLNKESQVMFVFKDISSPRGTTLDSRGNIIVVGRDNDSGTVVKILSRDWQLLEILHVEQKDVTGSKNLLQWEDLEFVPYCTDCRDDDTLVLGGIRESLKIMKITTAARR